MEFFNINIIWEQSGYLAVGATYTLGLTFLSMFFSVVIGVIVSLGRMTKIFFIKALATAYVDVMRGIPLLILIIWFYYGLSMLINFEFPPLIAGVTCLSLKYSGYLAETFRAGIQDIEIGQSEAALSLGFSKFQNFRRIVLPQALRIVIPPIGNSFVSMLQDSSMVMLIGIWELMKRGNSVANSTLKPLEIYTTVGIIYLIMTISASRINRYLEGRLKLVR
jgi:His/Glu/Gln/Arg/opine family amino acid ABC transporter permease subunit